MKKKPISKTKIIPTKLSHIIEIPKIQDDGYLCVAENGNQMPFNVKRFYYIVDVNENAERGFHAHKQTLQVLFCIKGSITVILDNGKEREQVHIDKPNHGIFLDKMMWHEMVDFKKDTVLLVAASDFYKESDYIRNYDMFLELAAKQNQSWFRLPKFVTLSPIRRLGPKSL